MQIDIKLPAQNRLADLKAQLIFECIKKQNILPDEKQKIASGIIAKLKNPA